MAQFLPLIKLLNSLIPLFIVDDQAEATGLKEEREAA